jgi:hypothetical protein
MSESCTYCENKICGCCCENGKFGDGHECRKQPDTTPKPTQSDSDESRRSLDERRDELAKKEIFEAMSQDTLETMFKKGWDAAITEMQAEFERLCGVQNCPSCGEQMQWTPDDYKTFKATEIENQKLREALEFAIEYLEPRLANKHGSRGLKVILPALKKVLEGK